MEEQEKSVLNQSQESLTEEQKKKLQELIEEEEGVTRKVGGFWNAIISILAVAMSLFAIYSAIQPVTTQILRGVHVAFLLAISFLYYPIAKKYKGKINVFDIFLCLLGMACIIYMLVDFEDFIYRAVTPELWDMISVFSSSFSSLKLLAEPLASLCP